MTHANVLKNKVKFAQHVEHYNRAGYLTVDNRDQRFEQTYKRPKFDYRGQNYRVQNLSKHISHMIKVKQNMASTIHHLGPINNQV